MDEGAAPFRPPFPPRPAGRISLPLLLWRLRRNLIAVFGARHYGLAAFPTRIFRRRMLVCNSPETVQAAFIGAAAALERKTPQMRAALAPLVGDGLIISDGATWRARRPVVAPVTHAGRIAELAPAMTAAAADRRAAWAARPDGVEIDMLAEMGALAAEIIGRAVFGQRMPAAETAQVVRAFAGYQRAVGAGEVLSLLGVPEWVPRPGRLGLGGRVRAIHTVLDRLIAAALEAPGPSLIKAMAAAASMDHAAFRDEAATLFLAGHETTATTLAWVWYLLSQDPAAAARVQAEADALGGRAAEWADLYALAFTRAVIEETLRLYPPIPFLAREVGAPARIDGFSVAPGDYLLVIPWLLHRNPHFWDRPDDFIPARFLPGAPRPPRHGYIPFSLGPRVCTGAAFAITEMVLCVATLAGGFAPVLSPGARVMPVCRLTLRPGETLPMRLERRSKGTLSP